jgi:hypothetical protein
MPTRKHTTPSSITRRRSTTRSVNPRSRGRKAARPTELFKIHHAEVINESGLPQRFLERHGSLGNVARAAKVPDAIVTKIEKQELLKKAERQTAIERIKSWWRGQAKTEKKM